jgi:hypothetical protein
MALLSSGSMAASTGNSDSGFPIYLNVYNLITHPYLDPLGMCAYHSGVQLDGRGT